MGQYVGGRQAVLRAARGISALPPVEFERAVTTATMDGNTEEVVDFELGQPGKYVLVCFLTDRDGSGKPHVGEGTLEEVDVEDVESADTPARIPTDGYLARRPALLMILQWMRWNVPGGSMNP